MSLTIAQRAELIQRQTGCTRDEALRRARIADDAARDAAARAARVQATNAGTVQRTQQYVHGGVNNPDYAHNHAFIVANTTHVSNSGDDDKSRSCDTGSSYSSDSGSSCDSGGGDF